MRPAIPIGVAVLAAASVLAPRLASAQADRSVLLRYSFQPECLRRNPTGPCDTPKASKRLDLGPQIAVWVEKADGSYVETLLVTSAVAVRGIGNRPGYWRFPSNWHFPYGKRRMALPVWAHARGRTYDTLIIQDDDGTNEKELWLGFHESVSSPDPYYCLSFRPATWVFEMDAITCPTGMFNSSKGRFAPEQPKSYYPPRNDLTTFTPQDCDVLSRDAACPNVSARRFREINDLDAVASATPPYGAPYAGVWSVPIDLAEGNYRLAVEVNKEFDNNASHMHEAFLDTNLPDNGLRNNFGQPSVVWKVPFALDRTKSQAASVTEIAGYGDWDGATGTLHPPDATISDLPGSGQGRLSVFARALGGDPVQGRVHVVLEVPAGGSDGGTADPCKELPPDHGRITGLEVPLATVTDKDAAVRFIEAADRGKAVERYEIRYLVGDSMTLETFLQAPPAMAWTPQGPGAAATVKLTELKPDLTYTVGVRARGGCVREGPLSTVTFTTKPLVFKTLSGCFVATAAYGSPLEPRVQALRRLRDRVRETNTFAAVPIELYERSSPPVASLLRETEIGRALVRSALSPLVGLLAPAPAPEPEHTEQRQ